MFTPYQIRRVDALLCAFVCWFVVTGLTIEHVLLEGISSWTLFLAMPVLTLLIGLLLHEFTTNYTKFRGWVALLLALGGFLVTLPSSIETLGNAKQTTLNNKSAYNAELVRIRESLISTQSDLLRIKPKAISECRGAPEPFPTDPKLWPECRRLTGEVQALESSVAKFNSQLIGGRGLKPIQSSEKIITWFFAKFNLQVSVSDQAKFTPLITPFVLELLVAYFLWLSLEPKQIPIPKKEEDPEPEAEPKKKTKRVPSTTLKIVDADVEEVPNSPDKTIYHNPNSSVSKRATRDALIEALAQPAESNNELALRMGVSAPEATRRVTLYQALLIKEQRGKSVYIRLKDEVKH